MQARCWKCGGALRRSAAIGEFCDDPGCDVADAVDPSAEATVRILIPAPAAARLLPRLGRSDPARLLQSRAS